VQAVHLGAFLFGDVLADFVEFGDHFGGLCVCLLLRERCSQRLVLKGVVVISSLSPFLITLIVLNSSSSSVRNKFLEIVGWSSERKVWMVRAGCGVATDALPVASTV
jgi:hypothetical protein